MTEFEGLLKSIEGCSPAQKQSIFKKIREHILIHDLETEFGVRAEVILEAIRRSSDLTKRGVRGLIAEATFSIEVLPLIADWGQLPIEGDAPYDAHLLKAGCKVRIQVKLQRKLEGRPMLAREASRDLPEDAFVVEVQRTRSGQNAQKESTRPYRFDEFDVLAVCMEPSTGDWKRFMYALTRDLQPNPKAPKLIRTFQAVPADATDMWTSNLRQCLEKLEK